MIPRADSTPAPRPWQFSVSSLLWLMVTVGMVLAYVRNSGEVMMLAVAGAAIHAGLVGLLIGAMLAALCAVNFWMYRTPMVLTWAGVGAAGGAFAGAWPEPQRIARYIVSTLGAGMAMLASVLLGYVMDAAIEVPFAAMGGLILAVLADVVSGLQRRYHTPRELWAAGLVLAVIAGNIAAAQLMDL